MVEDPINYKDKCPQSESINCSRLLAKVNTASKSDDIRVKLAKDTSGGSDEVALKIMKRKNITDAFIELINNEAEVHSKLKHQNIIELVDFNDKAVEERPSGKAREVYYLALELAKGGELFDYIAQTGPFSEPVARYFFHQISDALDYMHS